MTRVRDININIHHIYFGQERLNKLLFPIARFVDEDPINNFGHGASFKRQPTTSFIYIKTHLPERLRTSCSTATWLYEIYILRTYGRKIKTTLK